jgi:hypothetical protein
MIRKPWEFWRALMTDGVIYRDERARRLAEAVSSAERAMKLAGDSLNSDPAERARLEKHVDAMRAEACAAAALVTESLNAMTMTREPGSVGSISIH